MILKLRQWWQDTRSSFWLVPAAIVLVAVVFATGLIALETRIDVHLDKKWPLLFGAGAASSRGLLTAVAGSMITVAGVVFSITIVALSLTSSQYTSRVLRNFIRDRMNQGVLGVFLGEFVVEGAPLISLARRNEPDRDEPDRDEPDDEVAAELKALYVSGPPIWTNVTTSIESWLREIACCGIETTSSSVSWSL